MLFSSLTFLLVFLPVILFLYFIAKDKYKNIILLTFSLIFYAWGEPKYIILMIISIVANYLIAILIDKFRNKKISKFFLILSIIINIGLLGLFKYANFFVDNINNLLNRNIKSLNLLLPIGISFYTFQLLSYVIDVYKNKVKVQKNIFNLGTYVALFPQLIAGPIVRYETIEEELNHRTHSLDKFISGTKRFIIGLGKKVIISNNVALIADFIIDSSQLNTYGTVIVWIGMFAYTLQIYYDFSGYSDMAIGLGKIFGFTFLENFNYPYISKSITDFWRRWHISLSSWFRDYVYIPLGGNRVSKVRWFFNIMIVWLLTGLWHGASWNFVIWGLYFGIILLLEKIVLNKLLNKLPEFLKWFYSFVLIIIGWTIFRNTDLQLVGTLLHKMLIFTKTNWLSFIRNNYELSNYIIYLIIGLIGMFPYVGNFINKYENKKGLIKFLINIFLILVFVISILFLVKNTYNPFIYFRF